MARKLIAFLALFALVGCGESIDGR